MRIRPKTSIDVYQKILGKETQYLNQGVVVERKTLKQLLTEKNPSTKNKNSEEYLFDADVLRKAAEKYPDYLHEDVHLPIYFYVDPELTGQCHIRDEHNATFVKKIAGLERYPYRSGKMWLSKPIANKIIREYPTLFQFFYLPPPPA